MGKARAKAGADPSAAREHARGTPTETPIDTTIEKTSRLDELITRMSARFLAAGAAELRDAVADAIAELGQSLDVDRVQLIEVTGDDYRTRCNVEWSRPGLEPFAHRIQGLPPGELPWVARQLDAGELVAVSQLSKLPAEAAREAEAWAAQGVGSVVTVPIGAPSHLTGLIGFKTIGRERRWPRKLLTRLRLVGELFAHVFERSRLEQARRLSEERFRALTESGSDLVSEVDRNGRPVYFSPTFCEQLGFEREELMRWEPDALLHPEDRSRLRGQFEQALREGRRTVLEQRFRRRDGSYAWYETVWTPYQRDGERCMLGVSRNISERKAAAEVLRTTEAQLRQSQKMEAVGRLAGGVAHDFNNLLTVILGYGEVLLGELEGEQRHDVEQIHTAAERSAALVQQLLAFSRRQVLQPRVLEPAGVVARLEPMLRRLLGSDIEIDLDFGDDADRDEREPTRVAADPSQLEQVVLNLCINARDAMPEGGKLGIAIREHRLEAIEASRLGLDPGAWVCLQVSDTGRGMDPETEARVFEPFFTTKAEGQGTGLGLSTVHGIVTQSGGQVRMHSRLGVGTRADVWLPASHEPLEEASRLPGPGDGSARAGETVLLVEDEPLVRELARATLEKAGYRVLEAEEGQEALALADTWLDEVDLLLADLQLPHMSGAAVANALTAQRPGLPVLFMSGYASPIGAPPAPPAGADLLQKPFGPAQLRARVRRALDAAGDSPRDPGGDAAT